MNYETTIELDGTEIEVIGVYTEAETGDYETPDYPAEFQIDELKIGGVDVTELLSDKFFEIEEIVLNKLN